MDRISIREAEDPFRRFQVSGAPGLNQVTAESDPSTHFAGGWIEEDVSHPLFMEKEGK